MKLRGSNTKMRGNVKRNIILVGPRLKGVQNLSAVTAKLRHGETVQEPFARGQ